MSERNRATFRSIYIFIVESCQFVTTLVVPRTRTCSFGDRSFAAAAAAPVEHFAVYVTTDDQLRTV